jgi:hypothetical protein
MLCSIPPLEAPAIDGLQAIVCVAGKRLPYREGKQMRCLFECNEAENTPAYKQEKQLIPLLASPLACACASACVSPVSPSPCEPCCVEGQVH